MLERIDKIFMILALAAIIGIIVAENRKGSALVLTTKDIRKIPSKGLSVSATPNNTADLGPAYLLANLPDMRRRDEFAGPVSFPETCDADL
jgi:hypothetical protein